MNKNKAFINIITSTVFKLVLLVVSLFLRRYLLKYLGTEAVGLFSLFTSILGFLAIAELGIGTAITFSMYKPMVENDDDKISGLYFLYRKIYIIISIVMLTLGGIVAIFIPALAKDSTGVFNIRIPFILFLISTITTYLYAHKTSFINANLDNYITVSIRSIGLILEAILQIIVLAFVAKSNLRLGFTLFILVILFSHLIQWIFTEIIFNYKYKKQINNNKVLSKEVIDDVTEKTKAMFFHKIGVILVNTTDSLIISSAISVAILGIYTNYITLATGMVGMLALVFSSITSILGHSYAKNTKEVFKEQFNFLYLFNYVLAFIFFLGFYAVVDKSILLIFSKDNNLIMSNTIVVVITLNYFIQFMRQTVMVFKDASGLFYYDRYKPLFEGIINLILSLIFVKFWGIIGVLLATILTNLFITHVVEPFVLFKYGFEKKPITYFLYNYIGIGLFIVAVIIFNLIPFKDSNNIIIDLLVRGFTSVAISLGFLIIIYIVNKRFRDTFNRLIKIGIRFIKGKIRKNNIWKK